MEIDKIYVYKYDPNSDYYLDECYSYTTVNNTDILLKDRQDELNDNNISLCENNCLFKEYLIDNKKSICECTIIFNKTTIYGINSQGNIFSNNFDDKNDFSVFGTLKYFNTLFSNKGISKNIAFYIILIFYILLKLSAIFYYVIRYNLIIKIIDSIKNTNTANNNEISMKNCNTSNE